MTILIISKNCSWATAAGLLFWAAVAAMKPMLVDADPLRLLRAGGGGAGEDSSFADAAAAAATTTLEVEDEDKKHDHDLQEQDEEDAGAIISGDHNKTAPGLYSTSGSFLRKKNDDASLHTRALWGEPPPEEEGERTITTAWMPTTTQLYVEGVLGVGGATITAPDGSLVMDGTPLNLKARLQIGANVSSFSNSDWLHGDYITAFETYIPGAAGHCLEGRLSGPERLFDRIELKGRHFEALLYKPESFRVRAGRVKCETYRWSPETTRLSIFDEATGTWSSADPEEGQAAEGGVYRNFDWSLPTTGGGIETIMVKSAFAYVSTIEEFLFEGWANPITVFRPCDEVSSTTCLNSANPGAGTFNKIRLQTIGHKAMLYPDGRVVCHADRPVLESQCDLTTHFYEGCGRCLIKKVLLDSCSLDSECLSNYCSQEEGICSMP